MEDSKVSILIVDDNPDKLLSIEALLDDLDLKIVRAHNGREALRYVLAQDFAVILLDVNMPDMDGFETAQLIRQRRVSAHIPIIFFTAMSDEMHVARGYSLGAVDYILTPVVPAVLRSKVAVFVDLFRKSQQVQLQAERLRQRATQLHRLTDASLAINSAPSVQKIVQVATETARDLVGVHQAITLVSPGSHPAHTASFASYSDRYAAWRNKTPKIADAGIYALVCGMNKPMRMTPLELEAHAPSIETAQQPALRGLLAAPLAGRNSRNMGLILLSDKSAGDFTDDDQAILVQLAQLASVAIENIIFAEERESNRLKDEFLSTLSHELRTPLNAIAGWVQLLKSEKLEGEVAHGVEVIERNVNAQTKLIEDLLDLSRVTSGKLRLNVKPVTLIHLLDAAIDAHNPVMQHKRISLNRQLDESEPTAVLGDPDRLQQVFGNLLSNAVKFTPGGGSISVRLARESGLIRISVSDTGDGIDPEFLPHVFERFRQADSTSSRRHSGLGIGLTIVRHIVGLHRGTVTVHSEGKGRGATFTVSIPAGVAESASDPAADPQSIAPESLPSLEGITVLVVDDEPDAREVVARILNRSQAKVITAADVSEAISIVSTQHPDLVMTDLAMPLQDGFELLRQIRALPDHRQAGIPVIAITAYARPEDEARTADAGFQGHLSKPVNPAELVHACHQWFTRSQSPQTIPTSAA